MYHSTSTKKIGAPLLLKKLWGELGIDEVLKGLLHNRQFSFCVERVIFITVLHRLFSPGSDRQAEKWMQGYHIDGIEDIKLHHFYRAMSWLGEVSLGTPEHWPPTPRRIKDEVEEQLFSRRRTLFSDLSMVFLDTTSLYFEGDGGMRPGQFGHSKDHRPECKQLVVAIVLDNEGNPICSEILPGNVSDVTTLTPIATRLKTRFGIERMCIVADRGMISEETIEKLETLHWDYILGVRMRHNTGVRDELLIDEDQFTEVIPPRQRSTDAAPLKVTAVKKGKQRYVICYNEEQARKDRYTRDTIIETLRTQLKRGDKALVGNKGYRRYLRCEGKRFHINEDTIYHEAQYDGKWVLRTNTTLSGAQVALTYKQLWMVEHIFRTMKSVLETRPIFHKCDDTIAGHVFCSFLALLLRKKRQDHIAAKGWSLEWEDIVRDVDSVVDVSITHDGKMFIIRTETSGVAGKTFQAAGVGLPPVLREG